jgi:CheY-like chemotaxis protein
MSFRILLVEDDPEIGEYVAQGLREEGYIVEVAKDGHDGGHQLRTSTWDLVILDWWLPGPDGFALLKEFRQAGKKTPVLFLTARDAIAQRVEGLKGGADDYLCKPFAYEELLARVQALLRRTTSDASLILRHHDILLDPATNRAERAGKPLGLVNMLCSPTSCATPGRSSPGRGFTNRFGRKFTTVRRTRLKCMSWNCATSSKRTGLGSSTPFEAAGTCSVNRSPRGTHEFD